MKRSLIFGGILLTSCVCLVGCSSSQDAVLTNLGNQLDIMNNTINSVSSEGKNLPSPESLTKEQSLNYSEVYHSASNIIKNQQDYKNAILAKSDLIKRKISSGEIELNAQNSRAIIDFTTALTKNTNRLNETKSEFCKSLNDIKRTIDKKDTSVSQVSAKLNRLSNCMDSQNCFYKNLLNTLNKIESALGIEDSSFDFSAFNNQNFPYATTENLSSVTKDEDNTRNFQELLYQYLLNNYLSKQNCPNGDCLNNPTCPEGNCYTNNCQNGNCDTLVNSECPNGACYDGFNNEVLQNNPNYNAMLNNYTYGRYPLVNPSRNTDTYRPWNANIDTYRFPVNQNQISGGIYNNSYAGRYGVLNTSLSKEENENTSDMDENKGQPPRDLTKDFVPERDLPANNNVREPLDEGFSVTPLVEPENEKMNENIMLIDNEEKGSEKTESTDKKNDKFFKFKARREDKSENFAGETTKLKFSENNQQKAKGHTATKLNFDLDVNKKIEDLIQKDKAVFKNNENFVSLR